MEIGQENGIRYYRGDITPGDNIVMVFGSNPEGRHGAGAAKVAREQFGAVYGQGEGLQGNAYALPTKDLRVSENRGLRSISPENITENIKRLYQTARENPDKSFCIAYRNTDMASLNGYTGYEMMRMFAVAGPLPENVIVSEEWHNARNIGEVIEDLMIGKAYGAFDDYDVKDSYEVSFDYKGKKYDTLTVDDVLESEDGDHSLYVVLRGKKGQITVDPIEIITIAQTIVSPEQKNKLFHEASRFLDDARRNRQQKTSLDELLDFHAGSIRQYVGDDLATENRPMEEVMGDALSYTVRDALERGDNPAAVRLWAERAMKENEMTEEQRTVADKAVESIVSDNDIVLGSDGKPLVLWHGSPAEFEEFDFSHAGDNTGLVEYIDRVTGEKVLSDSDKAIFFTDNRELAISYGFLARNKELRHLTGLMTDLISCLRDPRHPMADHIKSKKDLIEAAQTLRRENDPEINAFLDRLPDMNGEKPISSMDAGLREELRNELIQIRSRYSKYMDMNRNGGVSNQLNNIVRQRDYLTYFVENFDRVCEGDSTVLTEFGKDFNHYSQQFFSKDGNIGVDFFQDADGEMMVSGFEEKPVSLKSFSLETRKEILQRIEDDLNGCIAKYNANIDESGYRKHTHLYPVLLKAKNPLEHDYQESAFPDKYKPYEKYSTAYIAARQVRKALADGNDAVIYRNIRDPFLGDTYGVFSKENIVILDRSLLPEEQLDSTLGKVSGTVQRYTELTNLNDMELRNGDSVSSLQEKPVSGISFIEDDSPYYKERTRRNAEAADVTVAFALDFNTAGERCTKNVAGSRYISIYIPSKELFRNYDLPVNRSHLDVIARKLEIDLRQMSAREGFSLDALKVNVAGNGLSTLDKHGYTQEDADRFVEDVFRILKDRAVVRVASIRSGGQTGIDEAGIKAAVALDIPAMVLAPKGWRFRIEGDRDVYGEQAFKARFLLQPLVQEYLSSSGDERSVKEFCAGLRDGIGYSEEKVQEIFAETEVNRQESLNVSGRKAGKKIE